VKPLSDFKNAAIRVLLTDIDGTLTDNGRLPSHSYERIQKLTDSGIQVIPVTGRPAGWCELIARLWPVHGVVGENGAFYFRYNGSKMVRHFVRGKKERLNDRKRLKEILREVREEVPGSGIASDQFCRLFDLAIDFREDVKPLPPEKVEKIVRIFERHGATAKVSNIHVNGWYGDYDKVSTCKVYLQKEFGFSEAEMKQHCAFTGDSPNDEPMFNFFPFSFAVANIKEFAGQLKSKPAFVSSRPEAAGFCQVADVILRG
jgi:HAD superfamily hydrolase (TIGR01484 family)